MALFARALFLNCIDRSRYRFRVRAMDRTRVSLPIGGRGFSGVGQRRTELAESAALKKSAARLRSERDLPKKAQPSSRGKRHVRSAVVAKHCHIWPVCWLCEVMEAARLGFHRWPY